MTASAVHDHVDVGQLELCADGELLDQELEIIVARQRHDLAVRIGRAYTERGRQRPAEWTRLSRIDPVARVVDAQKLRPRDLRQPDHRDVAGAAAERLVHLVIDALGLDRNVVEMALAQHGALAVLARGRPRLARLELSGSLPLLGDGDEQLERRLGVGDNAEIGIEDAADLRRLDVDMHEFAALGVGLDRAGVAVGPAVADAEHEIGFEHGGVAVAVAGLQTDHAGHQRMVVRYRAPSHQSRYHRHVRGFREFDQQRAGVGIDDAAPGHDQRALGGIEHLQRLLDLPARRGRLLDRQRRVGLVVELDFGELYIERQIDQHRTGTARAHEMEGLTEHARHQRRLAHGDRPFGHGPGDRFDVDGLEVFLVEPRPRRLPGDAEDRIESAIAE